MVQIFLAGFRWVCKFPFSHWFAFLSETRQVWQVFSRCYFPLTATDYVLFYLRRSFRDRSTALVGFYQNNASAPGGSRRCRILVMPLSQGLYRQDPLTGPSDSSEVPWNSKKGRIVWAQMCNRLGLAHTRNRGGPLFWECLDPWTSLPYTKFTKLTNSIIILRLYERPQN